MEKLWTRLFPLSTGYIAHVYKKEHRYARECLEAEITKWR
jgi:hypothetical protein